MSGDELAIVDVGGGVLQPGKDSSTNEEGNAETAK